VADTSAAVQNLEQRIVTLTLETNEDLFEDEDSFPAPLDVPVTSEELDPGTISDLEEPLMVEDMIANDELDDTSNIGFERDHLKLEISWETPVRTIHLCHSCHVLNSCAAQASVRADTEILQDLKAHIDTLPIIPEPFPRTVVRSHGRRSLRITVSDQERIRSPTGRLNGFGMNGLAASFQSLFCRPHTSTEALANRCAIFSTYDFAQIHCLAPDADLWRHTSPTAFWDKPIWLLPIHRSQQEHWVLVAVYIHEQKICFFDSLGERAGWRADLQVCCFRSTRIALNSAYRM
jgi:hypothetical protein